jgi:hypothetical protein
LPAGFWLVVLFVLDDGPVLLAALQPRLAAKNAAARQPITAPRQFLHVLLMVAP